MDENGFYALGNLEKLAIELGFNAVRVNKDRFDVYLAEGITLYFENRVEEANTMAGFDDVRWHFHGALVVELADRYTKDYDELDLLIALGNGELVVVSEHRSGELFERSIVHRSKVLDPIDISYLAKGDEFRITCFGGERLP